MTPQTDLDLPVSVWESPVEALVSQWWRAGGLVALSIAVHAWKVLKEVTIIFITSIIVWPQVKHQGGNTAPPTNKKLN